MTIPYFDANPEIIEQLRENDYKSKEYKKLRQKFFIDIGGMGVLLRFLKTTDIGNSLRKKYFKNVYFIAASFLAVFVWLILAILFIGDKEPNQFLPAEMVLFIGFIILEMASVVVIFLFIFRGNNILMQGVSYLIDNYNYDEKAISEKSVNANIAWDVRINDSDYFIEYAGMNFMGKITLIVNGEVTKHTPTPQCEAGYWVLFNCGRNECLLNIAYDKKSAEVFVDGKPLSKNPIITDEYESKTQTNSPFESVALNRKVRSGTSSFLSIIFLTIINIFLQFLNAPISFPFSLFSTQVALVFGMDLSESGLGVAAIVITASIIISILIVYLVLYYFSIRSIIAIWIAFAFLIIDTIGLVLVGVLSQDMVSILIDIGFHVWILWSILQFGIAKQKLTKATMKRVNLLKLI